MTKELEQGPSEASGRSVAQSSGTGAPLATQTDCPPSYGLRATDAALDVLTLAASIVTKPKEAAFSGIRIIRAAVAGRFSEQLSNEWAGYVAAGRIKPDYAHTNQARTILADTLQSLEDANFDDEQLDLLRKLFLAAASETRTDRHNLLAREYMSVGRTLATGEIRVLAAYHRYLPKWHNFPKENLALYGVGDAMLVLQRDSGLEHAALIQRHERSLIEKGLVRPFGRPGSGIAEADQRLHRLTDFGYALCEFLQGYERLKGAPKDEAGR